MAFSSFLLALAAVFAISTRAFPTPDSTPSDAKEHIVLMASSGGDPTDVMAHVGLDPSHQDVKYVFNNSAFQGFVANLPDEHAAKLNAMTEVNMLEETAKVQTYNMPRERRQSVGSPASSRPGSTWGLQRISSSSNVNGDPEALSYTFSFPVNSPLGAGVDIYMVDTGIDTDSEAFGGRAQIAFSVDGMTGDAAGHGTHTAGTAASGPYGVASSANIIGVKVFSGTSGSTAGVIAGIDYVAQAHDARATQPGFIGSVMSMSIGSGGDIQNAMDSAVSALGSRGVHLVIAAGNDHTDACTGSPGRLGGAQGPAITVGAVGPSGALSWFSNTGACVDVYAPGEKVVSAWTGGPNFFKSEDGTSMAAPHVTGVVAQMLSEEPALGRDTTGLKAKLLGRALTGSIRGSNGLLLNNGVRDGTGTQGIMGSAARRDTDVVNADS